MAERTKRGEEDRKREDEQVTGEPVATAAADEAGTQSGNTTRDQGVAPASDDRAADDDAAEPEAPAGGQGAGKK